MPLDPHSDMEQELAAEEPREMGAKNIDGFLEDEREELYDLMDCAPPVEVVVA